MIQHLILDYMIDQSKCPGSEKYRLQSVAQKVPCIRTATLLNTWINEKVKYRCSVREEFISMGDKRRLTFCSCHIVQM